MKARLTLAGAAGALILSVGLVGCSDGSPAGTASASGSASGASAATDKKIETVALMVSDLSNPFFNAMQKSAEKEATTQGFKLTVQDGRQDLNTQNQQIDTFIQQGIQVLLLNAVDSIGIQPAVERAQAAGMIVVAVGDDAKGASAVAAVNNTQAGEVACESMAKKMGNSGDVAIIDGTAVTAVQQRVVGCKAALAKIPGIKIVATQNGDNSIGKAQLIATDILTAQPNLKGIFGINDPTALGAMVAAEDAKRTDLVIVGVDGSPDAVKELKKPSSMFYGTATQDPGAMVVAGLKAANTLIDGGTLADRSILLDSMWVDRSNLDQYTPW